MIVRGSAPRGRRARYWLIAMIAFGPLSSTPFVPSVWQCRSINSSEAPGITPIRLREVTCLISAGSVSRAVALSAAASFKRAPTARSTYTPGTSRILPSYG
jgi:hypothetical protein